MTEQTKEPTWEEFTKTKLKPDDAKKVIGKTLWYMRNADIDKSGRGYYWPRMFKPVRYESRHLWDSAENCLYLPDVVKWTVR